LKPSSNVSATALVVRDPCLTKVAGVTQPGSQDAVGVGAGAIVGAGGAVDAGGRAELGEGDGNGTGPAHPAASVTIARTTNPRDGLFRQPEACRSSGRLAGGFSSRSGTG
jgi:hypothetical protein